MTSDDDRIQLWIERRRSQKPDPKLPDRVMATVARSETDQLAGRLLRLLHWVDQSRRRRLVACGAALLVGAFPFLYLVYVATGVRL